MNQAEGIKPENIDIGQHNHFSTQRLLAFNDSPLPEAAALHSNSPGFFTLLVKHEAPKPKQTPYRVDVLPQVLTALSPDLDSYISQATFFRPNRRLVNLWHLPLCFVDLDSYNTKHAPKSPQALCQDVRQHLADVGIPPPSTFVHSGRGVYGKWLLKSPLPQSALPRWNAVQGELIKELADFGADPNAKDASRVLRLVSTCNTKQPDPELRKVRVLSVEEEDGQPILHDFERLSDAVLPYTRKELQTIVRDRAARRMPQFKKEGGIEQQAYRFSYQSLAWDRVGDMRKLQDLRGPIGQGGRETYMLLLLNELGKSGQVTTHNFPCEAAALARECDDFHEGTDWSGSTFQTLLHRLRQHSAGMWGEGEGLYSFSNQNLIEKLEITPEEERSMKTLIGTAEKYRRNNDRRRSARRHRSLWTQARRLERTQKIVDLHRAGRSLRQIAVLVGCNHQTVSNDILLHTVAGV